MKYILIFAILIISIKTYAGKDHDHLFRDYSSRNVNFNILINTSSINQLNIKDKIQDYLNNFFKKTFPNQKSIFVSNNNLLKREGDNINIIISIKKTTVMASNNNYSGHVCLVINVYDVSKTPIQLRKKTITTEINNSEINKTEFINSLVKQTNLKLAAYLKNTISTPSVKRSNYIINNL